MQYIDNIYLGNSVSSYLQALAIFLGLYFILFVVQKVVLGRARSLAKKTDTGIDDLIIETVSSIKPQFYLYISLYIGFQQLSLVEWLDKVVYVLLLLAVIYQVVRTIQVVVSYVLNRKFEKEEDAGAKQSVQFLVSFVKWTLWLLGGLLILQNLGVNVTSLIAGLGIGGIAIAFALQKILGDLFASFAIYLDKPFIVGDIIQVGNYIGEVEYIGIKTTRIKSLVGEEVIIGNADLLDSRIQNFKRLEKRRAVFSVGVTYETTQEKLEQIPEIIKAVIEESGAEFDRAHFKSFGDFSLNYEIVYFVDSPNYVDYVNKEHAINTLLNKRFNEEGIEFAYPTEVQYSRKG